jgi:hypothetical protein
MAVWKSKVQAAPYDASVAARQKSEAYDGSATRTSTAQALRCQRGYLAANYDRSLIQSSKPLRWQFGKMYDVKKVRNTYGRILNRFYVLLMNADHAGTALPPKEARREEVQTWFNVYHTS